MLHITARHKSGPISRERAGQQKEAQCFADRLELHSTGRHLAVVGCWVAANNAINTGIANLELLAGALLNTLDLVHASCTGCSGRVRHS